MTHATSRAMRLAFACSASIASSVSAEEPARVAVASDPGFERGCRALDAELRALGVATVVLPDGVGGNAEVETAARDASAPAVVRCVGDPPRFVIRILDGSWPTDPAFVIAIREGEVDAAVQSTGEWLRNNFVGRTAERSPPRRETPEVTEAPAPRPPLPPWRRPFVFAGALHDEVIDYDFLKPFIALGGGFFPIDRLHVTLQLTIQPYRVQGRTEMVRFTAATDSLQVGVGYLVPLGRGHVGFVAEGRIGTVRAHGRGEVIAGGEGASDVAWNPVLFLGGGLWARTRSIVAFRVVGAFRTYVRDTVLQARGERLGTIEAHNWVLQWQVEVAL
jgi:hypothetical protein